MLSCFVFGVIPGHRARDKRLNLVLLKLNCHEGIYFFAFLRVIVKCEIICVFISRIIICVFRRDSLFYVLYTNSNLYTYCYNRVYPRLTHVINLQRKLHVRSECMMITIGNPTTVLLNYRWYFFNLFFVYNWYVLLFYFLCAALEFCIFLISPKLSISVFVSHNLFYFMILKFHTYKYSSYYNESGVFYVLNLHLYSITVESFVIKHLNFHFFILFSCISIFMCDGFEALTAHLYNSIACFVLSLSITHYTKSSFYYNITINLKCAHNFYHFFSIPSAQKLSELDESHLHLCVNEFSEFWLCLRHKILNLYTINSDLCNEIRFRALTIHLYIFIDYYVVVLSRDLPILYTFKQFVFNYIYLTYSKLLHSFSVFPNRRCLIRSFRFCAWLEQHAFTAYGKFQNFIRNFYILLYFANYFENFQLFFFIFTDINRQ